MRAPTIKVVRRTVAIEAILDDYKARAVRSPCGEVRSPCGAIGRTILLTG